MYNKEPGGRTHACLLATIISLLLGGHLLEEHLKKLSRCLDVNVDRRSLCNRREELATIARNFTNERIVGSDIMTITYVLDVNKSMKAVN